MLISFEKAQLVAQLLVEGCSIRSVARVTGLQGNTILSLLEHLGEGCDTLLRKRIRGFEPAIGLLLGSSHRPLGDRQSLILSSRGLAAEL